YTAPGCCEPQGRAALSCMMHPALAPVVQPTSLAVRALPPSGYGARSIAPTSGFSADSRWGVGPLPPVASFDLGSDCSTLAALRKRKTSRTKSSRVNRRVAPVVPAVPLQKSRGRVLSRARQDACVTLYSANDE